MSQLKGVQAETWLGTALITPARDDPQRLDLTWLTGATGIQRLRPDVAVQFSYRSLRDGDAGDARDERTPCSALPMEQFYFTDGLRIVILVTDEETPVSSIRPLEWERAPR